MRTLGVMDSGRVLGLLLLNCFAYDLVVLFL